MSIASPLGLSSDIMQQTDSGRLILTEIASYGNFDWDSARASWQFERTADRLLVPQLHLNITLGINVFSLWWWCLWQFVYGEGELKVGGELHVAMFRFLASQVFLGRLPLSFLLFFCFLVFVVVVCQFKQMDLNQRGVMHLSQIVRSSQGTLISLACTNL